MNRGYLERQNLIRQLQQIQLLLQQQQNQPNQQNERPLQRSNLSDHSTHNNQRYNYDYSNATIYRSNDNYHHSAIHHNTGNGAHSMSVDTLNQAAQNGRELTLEEVNLQLAQLHNDGAGGAGPGIGNGVGGANNGAPGQVQAAAQGQRQAPASPAAPAPQESGSAEEDDIGEEMGCMDSAQRRFDDTSMLADKVDEKECNGINENNKINLNANSFGKGNGLATNVVGKCYQCAKKICKLPIDIQNHVKYQLVNETNTYLVSIKMDNGSLNVLNEIPAIMGGFNAARAVTGDAQLSAWAEDIFKSSLWGPELELYMKSMKEQ